MNRLISEISVALKQFESLFPVIFGRYPFSPGKQVKLHSIRLNNSRKKIFFLKNRCSL